MRLSVIIPTYKRPIDLERLLKSLSEQLEKPEEILVIVGPGDVESAKVITGWQSKLPSLKLLHATKASVVHAFNVALPASKEEVVCLLDDDVWCPQDWSLKIKAAFLDDDKLGAYGGRDKLQLKNEPHLEHPPLAQKIGVFKWNGNLIGNHHCGIKESPAHIDVLKGCNLSFRRIALQPMQIDPTLEDRGAEMCWEIDICQRIIVAGYHIVYDNDNFVLHYPSVRLTVDKRNDLFSPSGPSHVFNEAYVIAKFRPFNEIFMFCLRSFTIGTRFKPGLLWSVLHLKKYKWKVLKLPWRNALFILRGTSTGLKNQKSFK